MVFAGGWDWVGPPFDEDDEEEEEADWVGAVWAVGNEVISAVGVHIEAPG